jgi:hypothetical protein
LPLWYGSAIRPTEPTQLKLPTRAMNGLRRAPQFAAPVVTLGSLKIFAILRKTPNIVVDDKASVAEHRLHDSYCAPNS